MATGVDVNITGSLAFNAPTVNLDGNLTASGGISGTATTVNVQGSAGGAEIQDGIDHGLLRNTIRGIIDACLSTNPDVRPAYCSPPR